MSKTADIMYIPSKDGAEYTAISAAAVIKGVHEMLTTEDPIGEADVFGEVVTEAMAKEMQQLRRNRAAELLRRVAAELDAYAAEQ